MRTILIVIALLLAGCQTTNQSPGTSGNYNKQSKNNAIYNRYKNKGDRYTQSQDGAPVKARTISFREPTPTSEPMSRYGNPTQYYVDGKTYKVLSSSQRYKERGVASWYGTKFHKQRTSSGEPYNMYVMSAAHRTLPLPTYVRVTNLNNGKVAVVKVNDRGPFHSNRIIDLSYAAAVKLGVFPGGTAQVEVEALVGPSGNARYYLQAGAFSTAATARQLKSKLNRITSSPVSIEHFQKHYIVRVGPFKDKRSVDSIQRDLARNGVKGAFSVLI